MTVATNNITDALGTGSPDFPQGMPTVAGDPIVESGSNTDGEWTKFADGTQFCRGQMTAKNDGVGPSGSKIFNLPVTFAGTKDNISLAASPVNATATYCFPISNPESTSTFRTFLRDNDGVAAGSTVTEKCNFMATGRWK